MYAYLLAKYGKTTHVCDDEWNHLSCAVVTPTFDMVSIQLYEGYSHADYNDTQVKQPFHQYLVNFVQITSIDGWMVNFQSDPNVQDVPSQIITVPPTQLVIGLANGWAASSDGKFLYVSTKELREAYHLMTAQGIAPMGFMYWDVADDGIEVNGSAIYMSRELNSFMHIR